MTELEQQVTDHLRRRAAAANPRFDLEGIEQGSSLGSLVDVDRRRPRRPMLRPIVAAGVVLVALVGALWLLDEDHTVNTVPATTGTTELTTTEEPDLRAFAIPFSLDGPYDDWTTMDGDDPFFDFKLGPVDRLPETAIRFAIPDAATPEEAVADITAKASSLLVISDPVDTTVGNMPATCMGVEHLPEGEIGDAPLFQIIATSAVVYEIMLEEGAAGQVCVVDNQGRPIIALTQAPTAEFAAFRKEAQAVLDTAEFCTTNCPVHPYVR